MSMNREARWERSPIGTHCSQRVVLDVQDTMRPQERPIPSIRKIFILTAYARAGVESQQRDVFVCRKANRPSIVGTTGRCLVKLEATAKARSSCVVVVLKVVRPSFNQWTPKCWRQLPPNPFVMVKQPPGTGHFRSDQGQNVDSKQTYNTMRLLFDIE